MNDQKERSIGAWMAFRAAEQSKGVKLSAPCLVQLAVYEGQLPDPWARQGA